MAITERYVSSLAGGGGDGSSGSPWTLAEALANAVAGDRVNIKADGTYALAANFTPTNAGSVTQPIYWRAYTTTIGDGGIATFTGTTQQFNITQNGHHIEGCDVTVSGDRALEISGSYCVVRRCNLSTTGNDPAVDMSGASRLEQCHIESGDSAVCAATSNVEAVVANCYIKAASVTGSVSVILQCYNAQAVLGCILDAGSTTAGTGLQVQDSITVSNVSIKGADTGIDTYAAAPEATFENLVIWCSGNAGYALDMSNHTAVGRCYFSGIAAGNAGTSRTNGMSDVVEYGAISLTGNPFNADFTLNDTAGAGGACDGAGVEAPVTALS